MRTAHDQGAIQGHVMVAATRLIPRVIGTSTSASPAVNAKVSGSSRPRPDEPDEPGGASDDAGSELDRRLASGEIDVDTYLRLRGEPTHAG